MKKCLLSILLILAMCMTFLPVTSLAEVGGTVVRHMVFTDMPNNWSTNALINAVKNGLLNGSDGKIMASENLSRAQMAAVLGRAFGATALADITKFTDVKSQDWFYTDIQKAVSMNTFTGANGKMNPKAFITREEAFLVLARALKLNDVQPDLSSFTDGSKVSTWAKSGVSALIKAGYVAGSNGKLNPQANITRAEFAMIMDRAVTTYITTDVAVAKVADGNVIVSAPNVTLRNLTTKGDLIIGDGVGSGKVILDNVQVTGRLVIRGGGNENAVQIMGNSVMKNVVMGKTVGDVRLVTTGGAKVELLTIDGGKDKVIVEGKYPAVEVLAATPLILSNATVTKLNVVNANASVQVGKNSQIEVVTVAKTADSTGVVVDNGAKITYLESAANSLKVSGAGTITTMKVTAGKAVTVAKDTVVTTLENKSPNPVQQGDKVVAPNTTNSSITTPPVAGGGASPTVPFSPLTDTKTSGNLTTTTTEIQPIVQGNTATATVTEQQLTAAIASAVQEAGKQGTAVGVAIKITSPGNVQKVTISVPQVSAVAMVSGKIESLVISSSIAEMKFDCQALKTITDAAAQDFQLSMALVDAAQILATLPVSQQEAVQKAIAGHPVFSFTVTDKNGYITDLQGGQATISLPYALQKGETADNLCIFSVSDNGVLTKIPAQYHPQTKMLTFTTTHFSLYAVGYQELAVWQCQFTDLNKNDWYYGDVAYVVQNGMMNGMTSTVFAPNEALTRGMLMTVLQRMSGQPTKSTSTPWYAQAVAWAKSANISDGSEPNRAINREELATMIYRYAVAMKLDTTPANLSLTFTDVQQISDFATESVRYCLSRGIMTGKNNNSFDPQATATRAEVAAVLHRFLQVNA